MAQVQASRLEFGIEFWGFGALGFGFWVLGFWVLGFGIWVLSFGCWVLDVKFRILGFGFKARVPELCVWGSGFYTVGVWLGFRFWGLGFWDFGFQLWILSVLNRGLCVLGSRF